MSESESLFAHARSSAVGGYQFRPRWLVCPRCGRFGCLDLICHGGWDV